MTSKLLPKTKTKRLSSMILKRMRESMMTTMRRKLLWKMSRNRITMMITRWIQRPIQTPPRTPQRPSSTTATQLVSGRMRDDIRRTMILASGAVTLVSSVTRAELAAARKSSSCVKMRLLSKSTANMRRMRTATWKWTPTVTRYRTTTTMKRRTPSKSYLRRAITITS